MSWLLTDLDKAADQGRLCDRASRTLFEPVAACLGCAGAEDAPAL